MAPIKRKYRTIYIVTAAVMLALIGGYALAATSLTTGPTQNSNVTSSPTSGFTAATITSEQLVVITGGMQGAQATGAEATGAVGLDGSAYTIPSCAATPCPVSNLRPINPALPVVGDYGEQIVMSVSQPTTATLAFDFSITVSITVTGVTSSVVFQGYLAPGTTTVTGGAMVPAYLYADLGTQTAPVINSISAVFNSCSGATTCP